MVASELWLYGASTQEGTFSRTAGVTSLHTTTWGSKLATSRSSSPGPAIRTSRCGRYLKRASSSVSQYMVGAMAISTRKILYPFPLGRRLCYFGELYLVFFVTSGRTLTI